MHFDIAREGRSKEPEALEVIEMQMGDEEVDAGGRRIERLIEP